MVPYRCAEDNAEPVTGGDMVPLAVVVLCLLVLSAGWVARVICEGGSMRLRVRFVSVKVRRGAGVHVGVRRVVVPRETVCRGDCSPGVVSGEAFRACMCVTAAVFAVVGRLARQWFGTIFPVAMRALNRLCFASFVHAGHGWVESEFCE